MRLTWPVTFALVALGLPLAARAERCDALRPPSLAIEQPKRPIRAEDLIRLRDIGANWVMDIGTKVFAVSPDGARVALQLRQANLETNTYCLGVYVVDAAGGNPIEVNRGGEDILQVFSSFGFVKQVPPGNAANLVPRWSPDGKWIAFLRRDGGVTQLWRGKADGTFAAAVTTEPTDVEAFAWARDGTTLVYSTRPTYVAAENAINNEAGKGFLFDDRFMPVAGNRPMVRDPVPVEIYAIDPDGSRRRQASPEERSVLSPPMPSGVKGIELAVPGPADQFAWAVSSNPVDVTAPLTLHAGTPGSTDETCPDARCMGIADAMWSTDGKSILFLRYEGWRKSRTGLYAWTPGKGVRSITSTDDLIIGCSPVGDAVICAHEAALQPREIVRISLKSGEIETIFDPNPEVRSLQLGSVRRLDWTNDFGIATFGDLVLPPSHRPGAQHPLVVVQYQSRGFLRGGTGDEFPIQLLAAHGFAVLSVERPPTVGMLAKPSTWEEVNRLDRVGWNDFRSVQSALEAGVKAAVDTGAVDPKRLGLTGLSNGSSTAQFAVINGTHISALALGTCCDEGPVVTTLDGPVLVARMHAMGYPSLTENAEAFWAADSIRSNAPKLDLPILMQLPDREYLGALESYMSLKDLGKPVEMFVYPDEYHIKWQPVHRRAAYLRVVDWFDFWLQDKVDPDPAKAAQYQRWSTMKTDRQTNLSTSPGP